MFNEMIEGRGLIFVLGRSLLFGLFRLLDLVTFLKFLRFDLGDFAIQLCDRIR